MRAGFVCPVLSMGMVVSSVATTCDCRTRSAMSPRQTDCVAREISKPCRSKMSSNR